MKSTLRIKKETVYTIIGNCAMVWFVLTLLTAVVNGIIILQVLFDVDNPGFLLGYLVGLFIHPVISFLIMRWASKRTKKNHWFKKLLKKLRGPQHPDS